MNRWRISSVGAAIAATRRRVDSFSAGQWKLIVASIAILAMVARVVVILITGGGFNLRIFYYFGHLITQGANPYDAPPGGEFAPAYGDNPPPELLLFSGLIKLNDSPDSLRAFFVLADAGLIATVGLFYPRSRVFRLNFICSYAFNPLVLEAWTGFTDDKSILLLCTILVLAGIQHEQLAVSWISATVLGVLKWYSVLFVPILVLQSLRSRTLRWTLGVGLLFAVALMAAQLPFFPDSLDAFARRNHRIDIDPPIHAAPTQLLDAVGVYEPLIARLFGPVALVCIYALFALRRLRADDAIVLSAFSAYVALPDEGFNRMLLIALPFLFCIAMSAARWLGLWAVSVLAAAAVLVEFRGFDSHLVESLFGTYGSVRHVLFINAVMALVLAYYAIDRIRGKRLATGPVEAAT